MAKGGKRTGAGRPKGAISKSTAAIIEATAAGGDTPLEYMLKVMRDLTADDSRRDDMAKAAAPYVHAKLAAIELAGKDGGNLVIEIVRYSDKAPA